MATPKELSKTINEGIRELEKRIYRVFTTQPEPPTPSPTFKTTEEQTKYINESIKEIEESLNIPPPIKIERKVYIPKPIEEQLKEIDEHIAKNGPVTLNSVYEEGLKQNEEYITDLKKQIIQKKVILDYLLDELINLREQKKDEKIINHLEDEFTKLRKEKITLEERLFKMEEHMRCFS